MIYYRNLLYLNIIGYSTGLKETAEKGAQEDGMQALMGMSVDKMVIVLPSALIGMYLIILLQKTLSERQNPYVGLIIPAACLIAATVLAVRPLLIAEPGQYEGLGVFCLRMWLTFNIPTIVFMFPYIRQRKLMKAIAEEMAAAESQTPAAGSGAETEPAAD